jgi:hypothetical protein
MKDVLISIGFSVICRVCVPAGCFQDRSREPDLWALQGLPYILNWFGQYHNIDAIDCNTWFPQSLDNRPGVLVLH